MNGRCFVGLGDVDVDVVVGGIVVAGSPHDLGDAFGGAQASATGDGTGAGVGRGDGVGAGGLWLCRGRGFFLESRHVELWFEGRLLNL
ncbi:hypothetical protein D9M70_625020 [compost metagenome]